ncbi:tripartite tricarboxylate transporter permease [Xanthobacter dioxanivorans]|uniref:Tripartite tricarboxylate transporter permease n=1 Tax=Xanthobacter dioxanivorans TaxID=2528964 RepID=A0A974PST5_9HYPH|nr:tripartite tricarboxylate transporter permease [Xanthobacter dioxanivorans]QRG08881.1 tripartite tricarboxylate transporter permease [Xanthobacter dioxanivorans]
MDLLNNLVYGMSVALALDNLGYCLLGATLGTLIGVLPGIGPLATFAILLPISFYLPAVGAIIMLAGVYYGAQYGGSITSILVNIPGEASTVVTCLDGHKMALQGRAGSALAIAALASLFAGCVVTLVVAVAGPTLVKVALLFGPEEYVALLTLGLVSSVLLSGGSIAKSIAMALIGLLLSLVGMDVNTGTERFTFGILELSDGIGFTAVSIGLFGIAEIATSIEETGGAGRRIEKIRRLWPTADDFRRSIAPVLRGTALGTILGILPGGGGTIAAFGAYSLERKVSRRPGMFGRGAIEGVAGPEAANNAAAQANFIPMLSLGIPPNALMALMLGAMITHGITPGPQVMVKQPELFWGLIASMWVGNFILVILNLPLIGIWVSLLRIRYIYMFPGILVLTAIGSFAESNRVFDVYILIAFALLGYAVKKLNFPVAPLLLGLVLGGAFDEQLRRALLLSDGDWMTFVHHPIALGLLILTALLALLIAMPNIRHARDEALAGED